MEGVLSWVGGGLNLGFGAAFSYIGSFKTETCSVAREVNPD